MVGVVRATVNEHRWHVYVEGKRVKKTKRGKKRIRRKRRDPKEGLSYGSLRTGFKRHARSTPKIPLSLLSTTFRTAANYLCHISQRGSTPYLLLLLLAPVNRSCSVISTTLPATTLPPVWCGSGCVCLGSDSSLYNLVLKSVLMSSDAKCKRLDLSYAPFPVVPCSSVL